MPLFPVNPSYPGAYCWFCGFELSPDATAPFEPRRCTECARMNDDALDHQRPFRATRTIPTSKQVLNEWIAVYLVAMVLHAIIVIVSGLLDWRLWSLNAAIVVSLTAGALTGLFRAAIVAPHIAPMGARTRTIAAMWRHYPLTWALGAATMPLLISVAVWMYP